MELIHSTRMEPTPFTDPEWTADGSRRASVQLDRLDTLWFNTGTLCNLTCENCYIESSPTNDALVYLSVEEVCGYLDEIEQLSLGTRTIGFTGGEPFMNPEFMDMLQAALEAGFEVIVLTNAMRPMLKHADRLRALKDAHANRLVMRVSVDHFDRRMHEEERGRHSWVPMLRGLQWLSRHDFKVHIAGRTRWGENETELRQGFARLFEREGIAVDAASGDLVLFPEMDPDAQVPEITTDCWQILGKRPEDVMCADSRMIVRRRGSDAAAVLACTLLAFDARFELGESLAEAMGEVPLNHVHCAKFCVLGGGSCTG